MASPLNSLKNNRIVTATYRRLRRFYDSNGRVMEKQVRKSYAAIMNEKKNLSLHANPAAINFGAIEINTNCNLRCIMCNTHLSNRKNQNMGLELFEKVIQYKKQQGVSNTTLHTIGEPLLNPKLEDYFGIIRKYEMKVMLSTNGQLLDKRQDLLRRYRDIIYMVRFSIDGATQETYEKIRYPGKFDHLISNLNSFKKLNIRTKIDSIVSRDVQKELAYHLKYYSQYTSMDNIHFHLLNGVSPDNAYYLKNGLLIKHNVPSPPCSSIGHSMHFLCDGKVTACGRDYNGDLVYGSILDNTPEELINNERILHLRHYHITNTIPKDMACSTCYQLDPRIQNLFGLFAENLVLKYSRSWDVATMQKRFDEFFDMFDHEIPPLPAYLSLLR